jgi:NAD(P)-dependent dehydrogenase (short-subunit alcohol dehydrogenase family)
VPTILITGANRGIGLEFARQYAADGWRVLACCRDPQSATELRSLTGGAGGSVGVYRLDVRDFARAADLAREIGDVPIDLLLSNAGVYGPNKMFLGQIDYVAWAEVLAVNTMAPLRLVECFVEHVARSDRKLIACISSTMGSMARNTEGRHYLYRSSKAALNAVVKSLSIDLAPRGIAVVSLCPGWVRTDMGGPDASLAPAESVGSLRRVLGGLTPADTGKFLYYDGRETPW